MTIAPAIENLRQRLTVFLGHQYADADQQRKDDQRQYPDIGHDLHRTVGYNRQDHVHRCSLAGLGRSAHFDRAGIDALAGLKKRAERKAQPRGNLPGDDEQDHRPSANAAEFLEVAKRGHAGDKREEDQRHDQHLDRLDEEIADPFDGFGFGAPDQPGDHTEDQSCDHSLPKRNLEPECQHVIFPHIFL